MNIDAIFLKCKHPNAGEIFHIIAIIGQDIANANEYWLDILLPLVRHQGNSCYLTVAVLIFLAISCIKKKESSSPEKVQFFWAAKFSREKKGRQKPYKMEQMNL